MPLASANATRPSLKLLSGTFSTGGTAHETDTNDSVRRRRQSGLYSRLLLLRRPAAQSNGNGTATKFVLRAHGRLLREQRLPEQRLPELRLLDLWRRAWHGGWPGLGLSERGLWHSRARRREGTGTG